MPSKTKYDVVIIGSGVAGALAAYKLSSEKPSLSILILEASHNQYSDDSNRAALVNAANNDLNIALRSDLSMMLLSGILTYLKRITCDSTQVRQ